MTTFKFERPGDYAVLKLDAEDLPHVGLIKIDVEGAQMAVLRGG